MSEAIAVAEQAVAADEVLAGLRQSGSTAPVDYAQLAQFTPNQFWAPPYLVSGLYSLAWAYRGAGQPLDAAAVMGRRVLALQLLAGAEPSKYMPEVATTLVDQSTFLQAARRFPEAIAVAEQAVAADEVLAGLRQSGSTAPVDYAQ
ncbi:hypothetical protein, partial [Streptomyces sioyaensis]|uniref:hypothetical protein n=1 Tax=Streptomyces sioyaensis TaxID=67364 RepID=UPI00378F7CD1